MAQPADRPDAVTLTALLQRLEAARGLAAKAAQHPGQERSHDHDTTAEVDAYRAALGAFRDQVEGADAQTWAALRAWCAAHDESLGEVSYPGVHGETMGWDPKALRVSRLQLEAMRRRAARGAQTEPAFWTDARLQALLRDPAWLDFPEVFATLLADLHPVCPALLAAFHPEPLATRLREAGFAPTLLEQALR